MSRPLDQYSPAVLAEWIHRRGFSFFPEELDFVERELAGQAEPSGRCPACKFGRLPNGDYCACSTGRDLRRAELAIARDRSRQTDNFRQALMGYGIDPPSGN